LSIPTKKKKNSVTGKVSVEFRCLTYANGPQLRAQEATEDYKEAPEEAPLVVSDEEV
jgi:hypothetical protein